MSANETPKAGLEQRYREAFQIVFGIQATLNVIAELVLWRLNATLGWEIAVVFATPTCVFVGLWWIRSYQRSTWRGKHPQFDYSGHWDFTTKFLRCFKLVESKEDLPEGQEGWVEFEQDALGLDLAAVGLRSVSGAKLRGWYFRVCGLSEKGREFWTINEMGQQADEAATDQQSHGRHIEQFTATDWDDRGRPILLETQWADVVRVDALESQERPFLYIGECTYRRDLGPTDS